MQFGLFVYCTVGRRHELERGMAGRAPALYRRMIDELGRYAAFAEDHGYFAFATACYWAARLRLARRGGASLPRGSRGHTPAVTVRLPVAMGLRPYVVRAVVLYPDVHVPLPPTEGVYGVLHVQVFDSRLLA